jgi:hypothetical protein
MRRAITLAVVTAVMAVAVPSTAYYLTKPGDDALGDTLRGYGFVPIKPPSNLMNVGSLYYVDAGVKDFKAICHAEKADLEGVVIESRSWEMQEDLERKGRFATDVRVDVGGLFNGGVENNYVQKVHYSLTDIVLEEVPLGSNWLIFAKLMEKPECNKVAMQVINAGGYVCQGQKIMRATAEFKLDRDTQNKLDTNVKPTGEIKNIVKTAIETQSDQSVVERAGRLFSGAALTYGVSMNPTCLAPPDGHFQRVLPRTAVGRVVNFVLFSLVEPLLPVKADQSQLAQNTSARS